MLEASDIVAEEIGHCQWGNASSPLCKLGKDLWTTQKTYRAPVGNCLVDCQTRQSADVDYCRSYSSAVAGKTLSRWIRRYQVDLKI